ncbi:hypothetical protein BT69DRAFT_985395 [Atractiella rhizophila]|nr:hypothetical protein BT69DRAFT_985395 [Atractiella rhizophila]
MLAVPHRTSFHSGTKQYYHDVDVWPSDDPSCKAALVFVTGNPGLISYYIPFLTLIHRLMNRKITILSVSLLGHTPYSKSAFSTHLPDLEDNIQSLSEFLTYLAEPNTILRFPDTSLYLMTHSIGTYITLQAWKRSPFSTDQRIKHLYALFPTISHMDQTANYARMRHLFHAPIVLYLAPLLVFLLSILPRFFTYLLVRVFQPHMPDIAAATTADFLYSPQSVRTSLRLAMDEMQKVKEVDTDFLRATKEHISWLYCPDEKDGWVRAFAREEIRSIVAPKPDIKGKGKANGSAAGRFKIARDDIPHAFCLVDNHYQEVASQVGMWLKQDVQLDHSL